MRLSCGTDPRRRPAEWEWRGVRQGTNRIPPTTGRRQLQALVRPQPQSRAGQGTGRSPADQWPQAKSGRRRARSPRRTEESDSNAARRQSPAQPRQV